MFLWLLIVPGSGLDPESESLALRRGVKAPVFCLTLRLIQTKYDMTHSLKKDEVISSLRSKGLSRFLINFRIESQKIGLPLDLYVNLIEELIDEGVLGKPVKTKDGIVVSLMS